MKFAGGKKKKTYCVCVWCPRSRRGWWSGCCSRWSSAESPCFSLGRQNSTHPTSTPAGPGPSRTEGERWSNVRLFFGFHQMQKLGTVSFFSEYGLRSNTFVYTESHMPHLWWSAMFPWLPSPSQNSVRREVRRNQRSQWRHNNDASSSWRSLLYSTLFAYIMLSKWHSLKMKHSCGGKRMSWCTLDAKCTHHNDSRGCVDLSYQTANSSSDTDTSKRPGKLPTVLK